MGGTGVSNTRFRLLDVFVSLVSQILLLHVLVHAMCISKYHIVHPIYLCTHLVTN